MAPRQMMKPASAAAPTSASRRCSSSSPKHSRQEAPPDPCFIAAHPERRMKTWSNLALWLKVAASARPGADLHHRPRGDGDHHVPQRQNPLKRSTQAPKTVDTPIRPPAPPPTKPCCATHGPGLAADPWGPAGVDGACRPDRRLAAPPGAAGTSRWCWTAGGSLQPEAGRQTPGALFVGASSPARWARAANSPAKRAPARRGAFLTARVDIHL